FKPIGAEIPISTTEDELPRPIELPLEEGRSLRLFGTVDRADSFQNGEATYVRVIDYKTNDKAFRLKNVDEGVNLQLLIYLLTLCRDKRKEFLDSVGCKGESLIPAGMLYCVTKPPEKQVNTPPSENEYADMVNGAAAPRGLIINEQAIISAHSQDQMEGFAPVDGEKDSERMLFTAEEFETLGEKTEKKLISMANSLARGEIAPESELGESTACQYCDFINVCGYTKKGGRH
ncbi:MAG: PD-(D/E)XK nuclease family protein, partial [Clostridia bacterium]|nr:PD-(D/E)XK nuclease family protein [Clostridia bacterium]